MLLHIITKNYIIDIIFPSFLKIKSLYDELYFRYNIPTNHTLIYKGIILNMNKLLFDYNIKDGDILYSNTFYTPEIRYAYEK